jgi:RNA polymerase sigma-70 factor (ECF subfamily)
VTPAAAIPRLREMRETTLTELQRLAADTDAADVAFHMDEDAFRGFYDRTSRALWAYLSRVTGDRQLADDLLQETYYRFLRASADYESDAHRRNALFHIATNLVRDARRRTTPMQLFESADVKALRVDDDLAERTEQRTDLERAMTQLKPRDRMMLWLAYAQGESHKDIATALGLKASSVKLLLFRARRKLASVLRGARS